MAKYVQIFQMASPPPPYPPPPPLPSVQFLLEFTCKWSVAFAFMFPFWIRQGSCGDDKD